MSDSLERIFSRLDTDGDGRVDLGELSRALESLGRDDITYADLMQTLSTLDADGDGSVSYAEFQRLMSAPEDVVFEE